MILPRLHSAPNKVKIALQMDEKKANIAGGPKLVTIFPFESGTITLALFGSIANL